MSESYWRSVAERLDLRAEYLRGEIRGMQRREERAAAAVAELRALLQDTRNVIGQTLDIDALMPWACDAVDGEPSLEDEFRRLRDRLNATLAQSLPGER